MARRKNEDAQIEFVCIGECGGEPGGDPPTWMVEGRFNAEGEFEPTDDADRDCPECHELGEPTDSEVRVAE